MRLWSFAKPILVAAIAAGALAALAGFSFVKSGIFDVGASNPHTKFTEWLTHETMIHSVRRHASGIIPPRRLTAGQVIAGFCQYETHCVACHGAAGVGREQWVSGFEPGPPYLIGAPQQFTGPELFWIVSHGIKMTGMPSWRGTMTDGEIWEVVAWIEAAPKLPPQTYVQWRAQRRCAR